MIRTEKIKFARQAISNGAVLLKNENGTLPIDKKEKIALFGIGSYRSMRMGWGSGDMLAQQTVQLNETLEKAGYKLCKSIDTISKAWVEEHSDEYKATNRDWGKWTYCYNNIEIDEKEIENASKDADIAIVTISRASGEADDLKNEEGRFKLDSKEISVVKTVSKNFKKTVLILNTCGVLDLRAIDKCKIDSVLFTALCGEQFGNGVVDILSGKVTPSGKLAMTWGYKYEDYPTCKGVDTLEVPYNEGIYVGYRYFDTFGIEPRYHFGFGLSYTDFSIDVQNVRIDGQIVEVAVKVTNTGKKFSGREVVQCYISCPQKNLEKAYQELCAYAKTDVLAPSESCDLVMSFDITDMASYDERTANFILESGDYAIRVGNSSRNTHVACKIRLGSDIVCEVVKNRLKCTTKLDLLSNKNAKPYTYDGEKKELDEAPIYDFDCESVEKRDSSKIEICARTEWKRKDDSIYTLDDVASGKATVEDVAAQFDDEEIARFLNGVIYEGADANANVGSMSSKVRGAAGEMWSSEKYKIPVNACADGPSGVRLSIFGSPENTDTDVAHNVVAYPSGTCFANSWDLDGARKFGECILSDLEYANIEGWLAPGINIQRNPLNGRNFEYFSEDPLISGKMAANITIGVQYDNDANPTGRYATVKHFACNNIEYERGISDSQATERALREIYLKGFKIAVDEGAPLAIMTSYNKINGEFASTNYELINGILRGEWGFNGIVMTDWNPCSDSKRHSHAGNDLIMPGCHISDIKNGLESGEISRADALECVARLLDFIMKTSYYIVNRD